MSISVAIIGGNLQGVEAAYLAKKAGWEVLLVDENAQAPASQLCDRFLPLCIGSKTNPNEILKDVDLILPALEDKPTLDILQAWSLGTGIPMAFDMEAYAISCSKKTSNQVFKEVGITTPNAWPQCDFPIVVKPDGESGSRGVKIIRDEEELSSTFPAKDALDQRVAQAYLEGPAYSIEVMGLPGHYMPLLVTELQMDPEYDCKRVKAPSGLDATQVMALEQMVRCVAERIQLKGLMDMEVILHKGQLKVLEIDARLPSQTPTAVFHATGINMVERLGDLFLAGKMNIDPVTQTQAVIYEHIRVEENDIQVAGEHIMTGVGALKRYPGLFGAHEVITNYHPALNEWVATLILTGTNMEALYGKRQEVYNRIRNSAGKNTLDIQ